MTHPFARGPMSGSAMDILGNLHPSPGAPTSNRHPDARLIHLGSRHTEILQEIAQNDAECDAISRLVREECAVPVELSVFAREWDQLTAENDLAPLSGTSIGRAARSQIDEPMAPWPAALTRSGKLAILEEYEATLQAAFERHGEPAVTVRGDALAWEENAILKEIRDTPALTIAGIVVKLRVADSVGEWSKASPDQDYFDHLMGETLRNAERLAEMEER